MWSASFTFYHSLHSITQFVLNTIATRQCVCNKNVTLRCNTEDVDDDDNDNDDNLTFSASLLILLLSKASLAFCRSLWSAGTSTFPLWRSSTASISAFTFTWGLLKQISCDWKLQSSGCRMMMWYSARSLPYLRMIYFTESFITRNASCATSEVALRRKTIATSMMKEHNILWLY